MHPYKRSKRVGDLLREEISDIIMRRVKDPRVGFVTVTSVKVTEDLRMARVYISVLHKEETSQTINALTSASGFIRAELGKRLRIKILPKIEFLEDDSIEYGTRIDQLIKRLKEEGSEGT